MRKMASVPPSIPVNPTFAAGANAYCARFEAEAEAKAKREAEAQAAARPTTGGFTFAAIKEAEAEAARTPLIAYGVHAEDVQWMQEKVIGVR